MSLYEQERLASGQTFDEEGPLPPGWRSKVDQQQQRRFYYNRSTGETTERRPSPSVEEGVPPPSTAARPPRPAGGALRSIDAAEQRAQPPRRGGVLGRVGSGGRSASDSAMDLSGLALVAQAAMKFKNSKQQRGAPAPDELGRTSTQPGGLPRCSICLADPCMPGERDVTTTPCGHVFCVECLANAVAFKPQCPNCRADLEAPAGSVAATEATPPPPLSRAEAQWYQQAHQSQQIQEAHEAAGIRRRHVLQQLCITVCKNLPVGITFSILYLMMASSLRAGNGSDTCMVALNTSSFNASLFDGEGGGWPEQGWSNEESLAIWGWESDCAEDDMSCLLEIEAEVAERWTDMLHYIKVSAHLHLAFFEGQG